MVNEIKKSEARILVYLRQVTTDLKFISCISAKLDMDYAYCIKVLKIMEIKKWVNKEEVRGKSFYLLTEIAPIHAAIELLEMSNGH